MVVSLCVYMVKVSLCMCESALKVPVKIVSHYIATKLHRSNMLYVFFLIRK